MPAAAKRPPPPKRRGSPLGKYRMLLALQALDPSVTAEEVAGRSMKQLREWEASLSGEADETDGQGGRDGFWERPRLPWRQRER